MISIPFAKNVKVNAIQVQSSLFEIAPKTVRLYVNQPHLQFEDCEKLKPAQEIVFTQEHFSKAEFVTLDPKQFSSVSILSLFVVDNQSSSEVTRIDRLMIVGLAAEGVANIDKLKKTRGKPRGRRNK